MQWKADLREHRGMRKWYGKQPRMMRTACGRMINEFAFGTRTRAIGTINRFMIVRNERFVKGRLRVSKARVHAPVANQVAIVGSLPTERFSGWTEQEFGEQTQRNRFGTMASRGGDKQKQMRPSTRLKPRNKVVTPQDYHPKGGDINIGGFIIMALRRKETRLIKIGNRLFKRRRKKVEMVQLLHKDVQPRRFRWMRKARRDYFRHTDLDRLWTRTVDRLIKPPRKM